MCDLLEQAQAAGPPGGKAARGWHLQFTTPDYDKREAVDRGR